MDIRVGAPESSLETVVQRPWTTCSMTATRLGGGCWRPLVFEINRMVFSKHSNIQYAPENFQLKPTMSGPACTLMQRICEAPKNAHGTSFSELPELGPGPRWKPESTAETAKFRGHGLQVDRGPSISEEQPFNSLNGQHHTGEISSLPGTAHSEKH